MSTLKDKPVGTITNDRILFMADEVTGKIYKITAAQLATFLGGGGGGGLTQLSTPTLTATVIGSTQINLSWTNVANESSYRLEWSANGTTGWTQIGGTIAANTTTYSHTGLTASTLYYYRIKAVGDGVTYSDSGYGTDSDTTSAGGGSGIQPTGVTINAGARNLIEITYAAEVGYNGVALGMFVVSPANPGGAPTNLEIFTNVVRITYNDNFLPATSYTLSYTSAPPNGLQDVATTTLVGNYTNLAVTNP